jgi:hypothetical protein
MCIAIGRSSPNGSIRTCGLTCTAKAEFAEEIGNER